ncbi:TPA: hypothetical protein ACUH6Q_000490 [Streptococcus agalactiae]|nr:hypothetical protein [Streptococcus agalactiae]EAO61729.1 conserved hypothetical protein [Streptococcus agalactiae 18RS21]EPU30768.1 hypothetical protein SAG0146_04690 [Streptococcus agalactiae MRI Z1-039]EPX17253.1 hypothetical protein SAG0176_11240 [Streptococcus agalactiae LDS 623]EPU47113.1 hypothetical protein SAG0181_11600 [Streptococcus agalactiae LDS 628]EPW14186.1 hypothetical protein SAG0049_11035 [Streptococcus agalactiae CCUG 91]
MRPKQYPYSGNKKESIAVTVDSEKLVLLQEQISILEERLNLSND